MAAAAPLAIPAAEALWAAVVATGATVAAILGLNAASNTISETFPASEIKPVTECPVAIGPLLSSYHPPPKDLPGFPDAERAKPKTPMGAGKKRARWRTEDGDILEWDYQHRKVERYDKRGNHKGEFDPKTGEQTKPADSGRQVEP